MNLGAIFLTGLSIGGLTCLALQGGLLASTIAKRYGEDAKNFKAIVAFLIAKLIAYGIFGFILGLFGEILQISNFIQVLMQFIAGFYMLLVALNLLEIHPIFRYVIFQPPQFLTKLVRNQSKSSHLFTPILLGLMTIFIPCGTTLAMETLAISSGNALSGLLIMTTFVAGTIPLFLGLGFLTMKMGDLLKKQFYKIAAIALIYLSLSTINAGLNLAGSPFTFQTLINNLPISLVISQDRNNDSQINTNKQIFDINVSSAGYNPNQITAKAGELLTLKFITNNTMGCIQSLVIPQQGIRKNLPISGITTIQFTPQTKGQVIWTCSMGMYRGFINVI